VGQHRSTQSHGGKVADLEEVKLRYRLREIATEHIRWVRRLGNRLLRGVGWAVNHKRVQPFWREEGLQRPTPRNRSRAGPADGSVTCHRAVHPHQVWAIDLLFDATADGRRPKFLNVITERSRLSLAIVGGRRCKATDVVTVLEVLTSLCLAPTFIRSDNARSSSLGPHGAREMPSGTAMIYIEPGYLWKNRFAESFNEQFGDEFLNTELFSTASEAERLSDPCRWE
jgi:putative transposase